MQIDLIILPMHDWKKSEQEGFRTRDGHIMEHFGKNKHIGKILVVDRPISLPEIILKKRRWRVQRGDIIRKTLFRSLTKVSEKTYVLDIFSCDLIQPLILQRDWWGHIFSSNKVIETINHASAYLGLKNKVLFLWSPLSTGVIGQCGEAMVAFDTLDNWLKHPEIKDKRGWVKRGYEKIKICADVIFTNSKETRNLMKNSNVEPVFIPNGVGKNFYKATENKMPDDLKNILKPIVGYGGKLAKRIDVKLLEFIATKLPKVNFVFIGQILDKKWIKPLFKINNIYFLGDKHYNLIPDYFGNFDICIIPHNVKSLECGEDPIKLYEYLSAGKPVVTTNIGGVNVFSDVVKIARTKEEFLDGINYWLDKLEKDDGLSERLKSSITDSHLWCKKADAMIQVILGKLKTKV